MPRNSEDDRKKYSDFREIGVDLIERIRIQNLQNFHLINMIPNSVRAYRT